MTWIVVRTRPNSEKFAAHNVVRQGCDFYLPVFEKRTAHGRLKQIRAEPVFKSYLFVNIRHQWRFLLSTFGIRSIIMRGESPAPVMEREIVKLRSMEVDGLVVLPVRQRFGIGERVRIVEGPFSSKWGLYDGQTPAQRNKVLIDCLGGKIHILVDDEGLEAA